MPGALGLTVALGTTVGVGDTEVGRGRCEFSGEVGGGETVI